MEERWQKCIKCICVCGESMISIPRWGFILPNVSSTWSRLRAQGHSMMGLIRASLEVEEPCQRGVCLTRLYSPPLPLQAIQPPGLFPHWKQLPERCPEMTAPQPLWLKNPNLDIPHREKDTTSQCAEKILLPVKDFWQSELLHHDKTPELNCAFPRKSLFRRKALLNVSWELI